MDSGTTEQKLAAMNDEGQFEKLAAAVLRVAVPNYFGLTHPGVNADGKTRKAPLDGIGFVLGANPPHIVIAHHTLTGDARLRDKWLHDPTTVKPRRTGRKPTQAQGDVLKTADVVDVERRRTPHILATLALTTNTEPDEALLRDVHAVGAARGLEIDVWSRSRLAHTLDFHPDGQAIRFAHFGVPAQRLSSGLLRALCNESLKALAPYDDHRTWVQRALNGTLAAIKQPLTLLVADSGSGKSVACRQALEGHLEAGGYGLVIRHQEISQAATMEQALIETLRRLHPDLAAGESPLAHCTEDHPLMVVAEDINRSGEADRLIEKLAVWAGVVSSEASTRKPPWRLVCPVWPQVFTRLSETARKALQPIVLIPPPMSGDEGAAAVTAVAAAQGRKVGRAAALQISAALGHDPLLIGLHTTAEVSAAFDVISDYVASALTRLPTTFDADAVHSLAPFSTSAWVPRISLQLTVG